MDAMNDADLDAKIAHLAGLHPKEIGARVGELHTILVSLRMERRETARLRAVIAEARQAMEASELPFYRGMELLKGERP